MSWLVEFHPDLAAEFSTFPVAVQDEMLATLTYLQSFGPTLGRPWVDTLQGSKVANLKELRCQADGGVWRVAFAFDGRRVAVLLAAADKRGLNQARFYRVLIRVAEQRWATWPA